MALGRGFVDSDFAPGADAVVVIGDRLWRSRFAADPAVIGREIRVDGAPATVVGVLPPQRAYPLKQQIYRAIHLPEHPEFLARPWFTLSWIESAHTLPTVEAALAEIGRASWGERGWT